MAETTYLRYIRQKCGITLMELEEHSSFSNQYLSLLELGRANCTPRNAETLDRAMLDIILSRAEELMKLAQICYAEQEENEACREMIEDNIREIGHGIAGGAMRHRFFLVFQYEPSMRAKRNTVQAIIQRLNEEADTARRYLDLCELEVLEPQYSDNFVLKLLYEILNKKTSQRVRLPEGVFDMTTAVHGIYEE